MKPQKFCGDTSFFQKSNRQCWWEKFRQTYERSKEGDHVRINMYASREKMERPSVTREDPIRTIMFLGSWSHT